MADKGSKININDIPDRGLLPGSEVRFVHSETMSIAFWTFEAGTSFGMHSHPHEQISHCEAGTFELTVGEDVFPMEPGAVVFIPPNVPHGGRAITACRIIDVFHPVREDYR